MKRRNEEGGREGCRFFGGVDLWKLRVVIFSSLMQMKYKILAKLGKND